MTKDVYLQFGFNVNEFQFISKAFHFNLNSTIRYYTVRCMF